MGDVHYCDNYEELTGQERDGTMPYESSAVTSAPQAKVVKAPKATEPKTSDAKVETKGTK